MAQGATLSSLLLPALHVYLAASTVAELIYHCFGPLAGLRGLAVSNEIPSISQAR